MTFITIRDMGLSESGKTKRFDVLSKTDGSMLGRISWFGRWRRYVYQPAYSTVYEEVCLREIADFIEIETTRHKGTKVPAL